jgi:hypothetical protein
MSENIDIDLEQLISGFPNTVVVHDHLSYFSQLTTRNVDGLFFLLCVVTIGQAMGSFSWLPL